MSKHHLTKIFLETSMSTLSEWCMLIEEEVFETLNGVVIYLKREWVVGFVGPVDKLYNLFNYNWPSAFDSHVQDIKWFYALYQNNFIYKHILTLPQTHGEVWVMSLFIRYLKS